MRPLPIREFHGSPAFVSGAAVIRGMATPVVDLGVLLGRHDPIPPGRFVTLRIGERQLALAVKDVLGVKQVSESALRALPPLLQDSDTPLIESLGALDSELLVVLRAGRILPDELWTTVMTGEDGPCP